jgi:hypothetical protein
MVQTGWLLEIHRSSYQQQTAHHTTSNTVSILSFAHFSRVLAGLLLQLLFFCAVFAVKFLQVFALYVLNLCLHHFENVAGEVPTPHKHVVPSGGHF